MKTTRHRRRGRNLLQQTPIGGCLHLICYLMTFTCTRHGKFHKVDFCPYCPAPTATKTRAFRVQVKDWQEATSIVRTTSAARAKFLAWNSAKEAGYNMLFGRFRVKRAPKHDTNTTLIVGRCYGIDHVEDKFM